MGNSNLDHFDACVVGAGVVGLAVARAISQRGLSVLVIEEAGDYGSGVSSRNSEVIHAGIYYPTGSLKAKFCVKGKHLLYDYCAKKNVAHRRIGKLIVASSNRQESELQALKLKAEQNGVDDLEWVGQGELQRMEPNVAGNCALLSPSTGIIDTHGLMTSFIADMESAGGTLSLHTSFKRAEPISSGWEVYVNSVNESFSFSSSYLINAAGLGSQNVAKNINTLSGDKIPPLYYCRGVYFSLSGASPFNHLIYPMPEANTTGLGVHATLDLAGQARFGPDVEYIDVEDYSIDETRRSAFANAIKQYYPGLDPNKLNPAYAGIRPKLQAPGGAVKDFVIDMPLTGLVNLFGIESPGLTSSLAIADYVVDELLMA